MSTYPMESIPKAVPLVERLEAVPLDARLITENEGVTTITPIGFLCSEAASVLRGCTAVTDWLKWVEQHNKKNEWVGLTDEEVFYLAEYLDCCKASIRNAEAKLKEKNT